MSLSKVLKWSYPWAMHDFRKFILLAFAAAIFFAAAIASRAQTQSGTAPAVVGTPSSVGSAHETQALGYWVDPATGLMWAAKDNGKDVSLKSAVKYCRNLRLAGYADWRLANMVELQPIFDRAARAQGLTGPHDDDLTTWHVKGNLFLTGYEWAYDPAWRSSGYHSYFDFLQGKPNDQESGLLYSPSFMRALCVRGSGE
jgi:hypothetical protein